MVELQVIASRPASPIEREVVSRELRRDARATRFMGGFVGVAAVVFAGFTYEALNRGWWLMVAMVGAISAAFAWMGWRMWSKRSFALPELEVLSMELLCKTHRSGKHSHHAVGPFRIALRPGWPAFWPEGETVRVELCLPPSSLGTTWASAVVVSLPGIDIPAWTKLPPPRPPLWLMLVCVLSGVATIIAGVILFDGDTWEQSKSGLRNLNQRLVFDDVKTLVDTPDAWSSAVTVRHAHLIRWVGDDGLDYLCQLAQPWEAPQVVENDAGILAVEPSEAEVDAALSQHCNIEERATQIGEMMRTLHRRQRERNSDDPGRMSDADDDDAPEASERMREMYLQAALEQCKRTTREALRAVSRAQSQNALDQRIEREVHATPANTCVRADLGDTALLGGKRIVALDDESGVLDTEQVWHRGAKGPNLQPLFWFLINAVLTCATAAWSVILHKRFVTNLEAWAELVRSETSRGRPNA